MAGQGEFEALALSHHLAVFSSDCASLLAQVEQSKWQSTVERPQTQHQICDAMLTPTHQMEPPLQRKDDQDDDHDDHELLHRIAEWQSSMAPLLMADQAPEPVPTEKCRRKDIMRGATLREYAAALMDDQCRRCHITQAEHAPLKGKLQLHHVVAIRDGGHPTDPSNLLTLCYFCHREWHTWFERPADLVSPLPWSTFMSSPPYWKAVKQMAVSRGGRIAEPKVGCCRRCGMMGTPCCKIRPFQRLRNGQRDRLICVCYWCQREWEVYWQPLRPDVKAFLRALPFRPST